MRVEGAYVHSETYPPHSGAGGRKLLTVERVNGNNKVDRVILTEDEARSVVSRLAEELA